MEKREKKIMRNRREKQSVWKREKQGYSKIEKTIREEKNNKEKIMNVNKWVS